MTISSQCRKSLESLKEAGIMTAFDVEVGVYPVDHDDLTYLSRGINRGKFKAAYIRLTILKNQDRDGKSV